MGACTSGDGVASNTGLQQGGARQTGQAAVLLGMFLLPHFLHRQIFGGTMAPETVTPAMAPAVATAAAPAARRDGADGAAPASAAAAAGGMLGGTSLVQYVSIW